MDVAYLDTSYFLDCISDNHTEKKSAEKLKRKLQTFEVVVPQIVLGEIMTILIRDYHDDMNKFKKKLDVMAIQLTALVDPRRCLPPVEARHVDHAKYFMERCGIDPNDASILSLAVDDLNSQYLVTGDQKLIESNCIYEYEEKLRTNGARKFELRITDNP